jgi:hypothetical protein
MPLTDELPPGLKTALRSLAEQAGRDPDSYIIDTLQEHVEHRSGASLHLTETETDLLRQISQGLPSATWQLYHELTAKRRAETLTPEEHSKLIGLSDEVEAWNVRRLELLIELSRRRGVPVPVLMEQLGLSMPEDA